ncbi:MAG: electron transport complex subunit RsxE [Firmicutes bacterium]|nr:electron transport complex subunit RsxE [Bacillota bacterium]
MDKKSFRETAFGGIFNNPVFVMMIGICPTIAKSTNIPDAFGLGVATAFVLVCSGLFISLTKKLVPQSVRLHAYFVIIAAFTTVVELFLRAFFYDTLYSSLGVFIPLIAVSCVVLARMDFAAKNKVGYAVLDAFSMGVGFILAITLMGALRQLLSMAGLLMLATPAGGLILLGLLTGLVNFLLAQYKKSRKGRMLKEGTL